MNSIGATKMALTFADLTDADFNFIVEFEGDGVDYFDYSFQAKYRDEIFHRDMYQNEIETLRENCKRILKATEGIGR
jgi:hypothetical protein